MTDYSKLSDTQIAEKVAREMGLEGALIKGNHNVDLLHDFMDALELPRPVKDCVPHPYYKEALPFLFFDWPAPLMMAEVKERLTRDYELEISNCKVDKTTTVRVYCADPEVQPLVVEASAEPRALYEAFLQVMEVKDE